MLQVPLWGTVVAATRCVVSRQRAGQSTCPSAETLMCVWGCWLYPRWFYWLLPNDRSSSCPSWCGGGVCMPTHCRFLTVIYHHTCSSFLVNWNEIWKFSCLYVLPTQVQSTGELMEQNHWDMMSLGSAAHFSGFLRSFAAEYAAGS